MQAAEQVPAEAAAAGPQKKKSQREKATRQKAALCRQGAEFDKEAVCSVVWGKAASGFDVNKEQEKKWEHAAPALIAAVTQTCAVK